MKSTSEVETDGGNLIDENIIMTSQDSLMNQIKQAAESQGQGMACMDEAMYANINCGDQIQNDYFNYQDDGD